MLMQSLFSSSTHSSLDRLPGRPAPAAPSSRPCRCNSAFGFYQSPVDRSFRVSNARSKARAGPNESHALEAPSCATLDTSRLRAGEHVGKDARSPLQAEAAHTWRSSVSASVTDDVMLGRRESAERVESSGEPAPGAAEAVSGSAASGAAPAASSDGVATGQGPTSAAAGETANPNSVSKKTGKKRHSRDRLTWESEPTRPPPPPSDRHESGRSGTDDDDVGSGAGSRGNGSGPSGGGYDDLGPDLLEVGDLGRPSLEPPSGDLDSLVASALAFDDAAFDSTNWGEPDWDLTGGAWVSPHLDPDPDPEAAATSGMDVVGTRGGGRIDSNSSASSSGRGSEASGGAGRGRRRRGAGGGGSGYGGGGGIDLRGFDSWDGWDYGGFIDPVDEEKKWGGRATAAAIDAAPSSDLDASIFGAGRGSGAGPSGANPGELRRRRRDRGGGGGGSRAGGWATAEGMDAEPPVEDRAGAGGRSKAWMQPSEKDSGVDLDGWSRVADDGPQVGVGPGRSGGGRRSTIRSESELRNALAAISTRLPRIGLSVTFPLPPAGNVRAAPAAGPVVAADTPPPGAPATAAEAAVHSSAAASPTTMTEAVDAAAPAPAAAAAAAAAAVTPPATAAAQAAAAAQTSVSNPRPGWATVPLSYNFGPIFRLLEERAEPVQVPLPEDLVLLAGGVPQGIGDDDGDGRDARDGVLHGCTAYTIAGEYQVLLVQDGRSLEAAIAWLRMSVAEDAVLGIDAEWPPVFKAGMAQQLAMLQIASPSRALLLHVAQMKGKVTAPGGAIHELLSDSSLVWVGCGWAGSDISVMASAFGGTPLPAQVLDVQSAARAAGWPRVGLLGLVTELLGVTEFKKPKKLTTCNWAARDVSERQVRYAAVDALLPPILLRQLRLFAGMPGLRCSFCKQAMHSPVGVQQYRPPPQPPALRKQGTSGPPNQAPPLPQPQPPPSAKPAFVCDHCSRSFWVPDSPGTSAGPHTAAVAPAASGAATAATGAATAGRDPSANNAWAMDASRPASKSKSLRQFLQGVVEGRRRAELAAPPVRKPRQPLFSLESVYGSDEETGVDSDGDAGAEPERGKGGEGGRSSAGAQPQSPSAAKETSRRKKKRAQQAARVAAAAATSSRQQALWDAFEQASPAAAAAVAMAMAGSDRVNRAAEGEEELQGGPEMAA